MPHHIGRRDFVGRAAAALASVKYGLVGGLMQQAACAVSGLPVTRALPSLRGAAEWLNSPPLDAPALHGTVVLIDFWTYSCINWQRTAPYVRAWAAKYRAHGLTVIGVHSPEFAFEKDVENVRRAVHESQIAYPVAIDSDHTIWRAFENAYWPAIYVADANGRIRHQHFGEGEYETSERKLQSLLREAGRSDLPNSLVVVQGDGVEADADWSNLRSQETYFGYERTHNFASPGGVAVGVRRSYATPVQLSRNEWALAGDWTVRAEAIEGDTAGGRVAIRFHARDVHVVMGPTLRHQQVPFRIRIDGQPPGDAHGGDVDASGAGHVRKHALYQLVRQKADITDRLLEIEFNGPGVEAFAVTYG